MVLRPAWLSQKARISINDLTAEKAFEELEGKFERRISDFQATLLNISLVVVNGHVGL
jgi:hypothetical protein